VHGLAQKRVVGQPVCQGPGGAGGRAFRARQRRQRAGPAGIAPDQLARTVGLGPQRLDIGQVGDLVQGFQQAAFGGPVELVEAEVQGTGGAAQQRACDSPLVALDQVQIGGRDADPPRQFGLGDAEDAGSRIRVPRMAVRIPILPCLTGDCCGAVSIIDKLSK
jgi:hypothetical protein